MGHPTDSQIANEKALALILTCLWLSQALCFLWAVTYGSVHYPDRTLAVNHVIIAAACFAITGIPLLIWLKSIKRRQH